MFLPGISSVLTFASLTVRPLFLSLIENHILEIPASALRPALKAVILALLPGLEEESSDEFERILQILNRIKRRLSESYQDQPTERNGVTTDAEADLIRRSGYFWQCLFLASITGPSRRTGSLAYFNRYLPKISSNVTSEVHVVDAITSPEPGLLIRCFATGLTDDHQLVQRGFLDMLVSHLPLNAAVFQSKIKYEDKVVLFDAAVRVVLRRDMSLNRRLFSWLSPPEDHRSIESNPDQFALPMGTKKDHRVNSKPSPKSYGPVYFKQHGANALVKCLQNMVNANPTNPSDRARPFRIALSLMDRPEIASAIVSALFMPLMRSVQSFQSVANSDDFNDVFRSANAFFDGVNGTIVWGQLLELLEVRSSDEHASERILLARFIVDHFNVQGEEMLRHVPAICLALLLIIRREQECAPLDYSRNVSGLLNDLLDLLPHSRVPSSLTNERVDHSDGHGASLPSSDEIFREIRAFYKQAEENNESPRFPVNTIEGYLMKETLASLLYHLKTDSSGLNLADRILTLKRLLAKSHTNPDLRNANLTDHILNRLQIKPAEEPPIPLSILASLTSLATSLYTSHQPGLYINSEGIQSIIRALVDHVWKYLDPSLPQHQVEAARIFWQLQTIAWRWRSVESKIASLMNQAFTKRNVNEPETSDEAVAKFGVLWSHTHSLNLSARKGLRSLEDTYADPKAHLSSMLQRPLLITISMLSETSNEAYPATRAWVQSLSKPLLEQLYLTILEPIAASRLGILMLELSDEAQRGEGPEKIDLTEFEAPNDADVETFKWSFRQMTYILSAVSKDQWSGFTRTPMPSSAQSTLLHQGGEKTHDPCSFYTLLVTVCLRVLSFPSLQIQALFFLQQLSDWPYSGQLVDLKVDSGLIRQLEISFSSPKKFQNMLIDVLSTVLRIKGSNAGKIQHSRRSISKDLANGIMRRLSTSSEVENRPSLIGKPPDKLLDCLLKGISSDNARGSLDKWIDLFCDCLPLYSGLIFQDLLKINGSLCSQLRGAFSKLELAFNETSYMDEENVPKTLSSLLNGLESCLAFAHDRLSETQDSFDTTLSPDQTQGFFGNMVSGVFSGEASQIRNALANNRLTVILCFQDTIRVCFSLWSWESLGLPNQSLPLDPNTSFRAVSLRLRNRSRQILEGLFSAEPLECLETAIEMWIRFLRTKSETEADIVLNLLHTLEGSRPKNAIPAIFNATYSRTNPSALDASRKSSVTTSLTDTDMMTFLIAYTRSLEDDVLNEIWIDCTTFLHDVLSNPMPQRQILPRLLEFISVLGSKLENTNFGEVRKMRRELGDLFLRLLTAIFTIKPPGLSQDPILKSDKALPDMDPLEPNNVTQILDRNFSAFTSLLGETDRMALAVANITSSMIGPAFRSRHFPQNVSSELLLLTQKMSKIPGTAKHWRKDLNDAFNDPRFFQTSAALIKTAWLDLLRQLVVTDKDRFNELLSRLIAPSAAGMMFGVGATAARLDADRKTQYTFRRIALLTLATEQESFVGILPQILTKLDELSAATHVSSPSSATRADMFMLLRALVLQCSPIHLGSFWPFISYEVQRALSSLLPGGESETYNQTSILQAAKLLDVLLLLRPDEFQLQEWLFITDTVDAIYRPDNWHPVAIADELSIAMNESGYSSTTPQVQSQAARDLKRPWLCSDATRSGEDVLKLLRPFLNQLSIHAFERAYDTAGAVDLVACRDDLLEDLMCESLVEGSAS